MHDALQVMCEQAPSAYMRDAFKPVSVELRWGAAASVHCAHSRIYKDWIVTDKLIKSGEKSRSESLSEIQSEILITIVFINKKWH